MQEFKSDDHLLQIVEQTNPIKDIVFENFEQEVLINKLLQKLSSKEKEIENQRRFKRNKELICRNHLSVRIYHYRDNIGKPRITVCAIYDKKENKYHRGVSFCSFLDNVSKESGSNNQWLIGVVNPVGQGTINVQASLEGQDGETKMISLALGIVQIINFYH